MNADHSSSIDVRLTAALRAYAELTVDPCAYWPVRRRRRHLFVFIRLDIAIYYLQSTIAGDYIYRNDRNLKAFNATTPAGLSARRPMKKIVPSSTALFYSQRDGNT